MPRYTVATQVPDILYTDTQWAHIIMTPCAPGYIRHMFMTSVNKDVVAICVHDTRYPGYVWGCSVHETVGHML